MRAWTMATVGILAAGCEPYDAEWQDEGVLYATTRGVVLLPHGDRAHAGMYGTTCEVDTATGWVGADYDYPGPSEDVQDAGTVNGVDVAVIVTDATIDVLTPDSELWAARPSPDVALPGVAEARLTDGGLVILADDGAGCALHWSQTGASLLLGGPCTGQGLSVDPVDGTAFVSGDRGVIAVTPTSATRIDPDADLGVYDATADVVYTARVGDAWVQAALRDGTRLWRVDLPGTVRSLDDRGVAGSAAVLVETPVTSDLYVLDAVSGEARLAVSVPLGVDEVVFAADGNRFALVRPHEVRFRRLGR